MKDIEVLIMLKEIKKLGLEAGDYLRAYELMIGRLKKEIKNLEGGKE